MPDLAPDMIERLRTMERRHRNLADDTAAVRLAEDYLMDADALAAVLTVVERLPVLENQIEKLTAVKDILNEFLPTLHQIGGDSCLVGTPLEPHGHRLLMALREAEAAAQAAKEVGDA